VQSDLPFIFWLVVEMFDFLSLFSVGLMSFSFAGLFAGFYLLKFLLEKIGAWRKREDGPKDRVLFSIFLNVIFGFVVGSFAQLPWEAGLACHAKGQPLIPCVMQLTGAQMRAK
jgi:hypothetical protein